ncbi:unnamed protein product [Umbelopsis ramanniana]
MRQAEVFAFFGFALICHTRYHFWLAIFEWRLMMEYVDAFQENLINLIDLQTKIHLALVPIPASIFKLLVVLFPPSVSLLYFLQTPRARQLTGFSFNTHRS